MQSLCLFLVVVVNIFSSLDLTNHLEGNVGASLDILVGLSYLSGGDLLQDRWLSHLQHCTVQLCSNEPLHKALVVPQRPTIGLASVDKVNIDPGIRPAPGTATKES